MDFLYNGLLHGPDTTDSQLQPATATAVHHAHPATNTAQSWGLYLRCRALTSTDPRHYRPMTPPQANTCRQCSPQPNCSWQALPAALAGNQVAPLPIQRLAPASPCQQWPTRASTTAERRCPTGPSACLHLHPIQQQTRPHARASSPPLPQHGS